MIALLAAFGFDVHAVDGAQLALIYARCAFFQAEANARLAQAVAETNAGLAGPARFFFADPHFGPQNAVFANEPWLFGINSDFSPQDAMKGDRAGFCATQAEQGEKPFCIRASMGHPNSTGAKAYATAIYPYIG